MKKTILTAFAAIAATSSVQAAAIYDNGGPDAFSGNETTAWVQAEDFTLAGGGTIVSAGVYIGGLVGDNSEWDGSFQYNIFSDAPGQPGASLASGSVTASVSDTGTPWCCGGNAFLYEFNLDSAFVAAAGTTYWLGIHASSDFDGDNLFWVTTAANGTASGQESRGGTFDNWFDNGQEHAFYLSDTAVGSAVPEPATWAFMIFGFGAIGGALRRNRKANVKVSYA